MKIISIIGSSAQKVLLPLLQYPERFDSAVFIVQKSEQEAYSYIKSFLDEKRDRTGREFRCREVAEINSPDYDSFMIRLQACCGNHLPEMKRWF